MFGTVLRKFCTSSLIRPPVATHGIYGRYAAALYSAAMKKDSLETVEKDLVKLRAALLVDNKLKVFMENRTISKKIKGAGVKLVAEKLGLTAETSNLLQLMAENGRLTNFKSLFDNFTNIMVAHRQEVLCEVVAAEELSPPDRQDLETSLKQFLRGEQKLILTVKIDPAIIGGLIVTIGDYYADLSIATKIQKYKEILSVPFYK